MKTGSFLMTILILALVPQFLFSQVEIKGTGATGSTFTFITKNSNNDTSFVVKDNGYVGIDTVTPAYDLHVKGTIMADTLRFGDGTFQTTTASNAREIIVATSGGNFPDIQAALAYCASLTPSPVNQFLIRVLPGNYPSKSTGVICLEYVHLKGSGKYSTTINDPVIGADSCVIEDFFLARGVVCNGTSPTILHNIITCTSADNSDGIYNHNGARPWIKENEILDCNGFGINNIGFGTDPWIIANKIHRNEMGGIRCQDSSPLISNNFIDHNNIFGILLIGELFPTEPTIDDNVIGHTDYNSTGIGIMMTGLAEPRIIANDIYLNATGIEIHPSGQPSILSNNINYNRVYGILTMSNGASKPVVIQGNHIHSSAVAAPPSAGIWIAGNTVPIIAHNVVTDNDPLNVNPDIDYSANAPSTPVLNLNVYDLINRIAPPVPGTGQFNTTSTGLIIAP